MLRNRVISSLIALSALSVFSLSAFAQGTKPGDAKPTEKAAKGAPQRDAKGRFIKGGSEAAKPAEKAAKSGPARDEKGRFIKGGGAKSATAGAPKMGGAPGAKMAGAPKMAAGAKPAAVAGKPVWDAKANRWRLNGKFISEAEALKLGGKK